MEELSWRGVLAASGEDGLVTLEAARALENARDIAQQKQRAWNEAGTGAYIDAALLKAANLGHMIVSGKVSYHLDGKKVTENFLRPITWTHGRGYFIQLYVGNSQRHIPLFPVRKNRFQLTKLKGEMKRMNAIGKRAWRKLGL